MVDAPWRTGTGGNAFQGVEEALDEIALALEGEVGLAGAFSGSGGTNRRAKRFPRASLAFWWGSMAPGKPSGIG